MFEWESIYHFPVLYKRVLSVVVQKKSQREILQHNIVGTVMNCKPETVTCEVSCFKCFYSKVRPMCVAVVSVLLKMISCIPGAQ